jgi:hypothetical protein
VPSGQFLGAILLAGASKAYSSAVRFHPERCSSRGLIASDRNPSVTMMNMVEELLAPDDVSAYVGVWTR